MKPNEPNNISISQEGKLVHSVDLGKVRPHNDPNCEHEFVIDESDTNDNWVAYTCLKCPVGKLFKRP